MAMKNNIELCTASDFCAINCHAFFDGNTLPEDAGQFVKDWVKQISEAAGGKTVVVSESGWPHQGNPNDKAIPSPENQAAAIASLKAAFGGGSNLVLYNSYNDLWKSDSAGTFGSVAIFSLGDLSSTASHAHTDVSHLERRSSGVSWVIVRASQVARSGTRARTCCQLEYCIQCLLSFHVRCICSKGEGFLQRRRRQWGRPQIV